MEWLLILAILVGVTVWIYRRGDRVRQEMGIDPETTLIGDALRARKQQLQVEKGLKNSGKAIGDPNLGKAMGEAFMEMSGVCPVCNELVWKDAEKCDHCGHRLKDSSV